MITPPPIPLGPTRARQGARRRILDEAEALLVTGGVDAFSIRKLVAQCGFTAPTLYHHFGDKQRLVDAVLEVRFAELADELRAVPASMDPIERLRMLALVFGRFGVEHPTHYELFTLSRGEDGLGPPSGEACRALLAEPLDHLAELGSIMADDVEVLRQAFWALVHGVISLRVMRPEFEWNERLLAVALDGLIAGTILRPAGTMTGEMGS